MQRGELSIFYNLRTIVGALTVAIVKNSIKLKGDYFYGLLPGFIPAFIAVVVVSLVARKDPRKQHCKNLMG
jgi:uncharacterized membrane protein (GlpM family)